MPLLSLLIACGAGTLSPSVELTDARWERDFDVNPITDCGSDGVYQLDEGEGLTADPLVYAGVVYFTTWVPDEDRCEGGVGRL
jgi:hypothetical protein